MPICIQGTIRKLKFPGSRGTVWKCGRKIRSQHFLPAVKSMFLQMTKDMISRTVFERDGVL